MLLVTDVALDWSSSALLAEGDSGVVRGLGQLPQADRRGSILLLQIVGAQTGSPVTWIDVSAHELVSWLLRLHGAMDCVAC